MPLVVMSEHRKPWTQRAAGEQAGGSSEGNATDERKKGSQGLKPSAMNERKNVP